MKIICKCEKEYIETRFNHIDDIVCCKFCGSNLFCVVIYNPLNEKWELYQSEALKNQ